jgi:nudix motif 8
LLHKSWIFRQLWRCIDDEMFRTLTSNTSPSLISLTSPFTRNSLNVIRTALSVASSKLLPNNFDANETNAAVLIPFCNVNETPGVLLEVRGKLRTHSGEVRCAV